MDIPCSFTCGMKSQEDNCKIKQEITNDSQDKLTWTFWVAFVRSLNLMPGQRVDISNTKQMLSY